MPDNQEALDGARSWIAEELLHRTQGGKPRMVALTTNELRALAAQPPSAPAAGGVSEAWWQRLADEAEALGELPAVATGQSAWAIQASACLRKCAAALSAALAGGAGGQAIPVGWKLVPEEPTDPMCEAGRVVVSRSAAGNGAPFEFPDIEHLYDVFVAMLAAAPPAPAQTEGA